MPRYISPAKCAPRIVQLSSCAQSLSRLIRSPRNLLGPPDSSLPFIQCHKPPISPSPTMSSPPFTHPPPPTSFTKLSFPGPHILLVTLSRPRALNCINSAGHAELDAVWSWLDNEPVLRVGVVTGQGRAFCAGADLKGEANPLLITPERF